MTTTTPAKTTPTTPAKTAPNPATSATAPKAAAPKAAPKPGTTAARIAELEAKLAEATARASRPDGYRAYATKETPRAMREFASWIAREFPELKIATGPDGRADERTERLVTIASKAYKSFQSSDLNSYRA